MISANKYGEASIMYLDENPVFDMLELGAYSCFILGGGKETYSRQPDKNSANIDFHTAYFFMTGYCSWGQTSELIQCSHVGAIGHSENQVLVPKREKGIGKGIFLKPVSKYYVRNPEPLFGSRPNLGMIVSKE